MQKNFRLGKIGGSVALSVPIWISCNQQTYDNNDWGSGVIWIIYQFADGIFQFRGKKSITTTVSFKSYADRVFYYMKTRTTELRDTQQKLNH